MVKKYDLSVIANDEKKLNLIKYAMAKNLDIRILLSEKYCYYEMKLISSGLERGLSKEQILAYINLGFSEKQIKEIYYGLEFGLSNDQIAIYTNLEFDEYQMEQIRLGFSEGLSKEQVLTYAKPELSMEEMVPIRIEIREKNREKENEIRTILNYLNILEQKDEIITDYGTRKM